MDPNREDWARMTPLQVAAREGQVAVVEALLARSETRVSGRSLHLALYGNHTEACKAILCRADLPINYADSDGDTALHIALRKSSLDVWEAILQRCDADVTL